MAKVSMTLDPDAQSYTDDEIVGKVNAAAVAITRADSVEVAAILESATELLMSDAERTKLSGVEANAKDDQSGAEIKTAYEGEANAYTDTKDTKLTGIAAGAEVNDADLAALDPTQNTKLNGIEALAEVNPADLDEVPDSASRFAAVEAGAKDDQIGTEIRDLIVALADADRKILVTDPASGEHRVYAVQRLAAGDLEVDYDDTPEA